MEPCNRRCLRNALGLAVEFAFHSKLIVNGKPKKVWSQVRPMLQDIIHKGVAKNKAAMPATAAEGVEQIAKDLVRDAAAVGTSAPGEKNIMLWMTEASAETVRKWLSSNGSTNPCDHAAFCAAKNKLLGRLCKCRRDPSCCPVHAEASATLADVLWWCADAIYEYMPCAVPTFPLAMVVKVSSAPSAAAPVAGLSGHNAPGDSGLPAFCHFLCKEQKVVEDNQEVTMWVPNNGALEILIRMRPVYLLTLLQTVLQALARGPGNRDSKEPCRFADFAPSRLVKLCEQLLSMLGATKGKQSPDHGEGTGTGTGESPVPTAAEQLEILLLTMVADESEWATGWVKFISKCMSVTSNLDLAAAETDVFTQRVAGVRVHELGLDVPARLRYLVNDENQKVKAEAASPMGKKHPAAAEEISDRGSPAGEEHALCDVYTYHPADGVIWNVLDVLSLQSQIAAHLYAKACLA